MADFLRVEALRTHFKSFFAHSHQFLTFLNDLEEDVLGFLLVLLHLRRIHMIEVFGVSEGLVRPFLEPLLLEHELLAGRMLSLNELRGDDLLLLC